MSDCSNGSVNKYVIVQPIQTGGAGSFSGLTVCGGSGISVDVIIGCTTDGVNINGTTFNNDGSVLFNSSLSACTSIHTSNIYSCYSGITLHTNIEPSVDDLVYLGSPSKRFRDVNTVSGTSTVWTSTNQVITPNLNLGLDLSGNTRIITRRILLKNNKIFIKK